MNILIVSQLTLVPVLIGALLGYRRGGRSTLVSMARVFVSWGIGIGIAFYGLRHGLYWPAGLISPIVVGLLSALFSHKILSWHEPYSISRKSIGVFQHTLGKMLGAILGFVVALGGWEVVMGS